VKLKHYTYQLSKSTAESDGRVIIEGFANKAITDSIGDYMVASGAKLERFQQNPIMFFNHDRSYPIGKITEVKQDDEQGLWVRGEISASDDPKIKFVRDLIKEGILKTFSIGYNELNASRQQDGSRKVTDWELHEVSVVTIPMNQASTFSLAKHLENKDYEGALNMIKKAIGDQPPTGQTPPPAGEEDENEPCEVCGNAPCTCEKPPMNTDEDSAPAPTPPVKPEDENKPNEDETAKATAFEQCVSNKIPKLIDEGKPEDQAVAIAISMCREEGKCSIQPDDEAIKRYVILAGECDRRRKQATMVPDQTTRVNADTPPPQNDLLDALKRIEGLLMQVVAKLDSLGGATPPADSTPPPNQTPANVPPPNEQQQDSSRLATVQKMFDSIDRELKQLGA
jgi:HK97 family phage prohead protease